MRFALAVLLFAAYTPAVEKWNQPVEPFRIAGNVYYVGANEITSYLIVTPKGLIVIDGGFAETAPMIRRNIEKLGFRFRDVRILLSSHAHFDHAGGLAWLREQSGATLYATAADAPLLARGGADDPQFGNRFLFPPVTPDRLLRDGERISLGGTTLTAHITPGHTPGCTTWTMRTRDRGRMLDVVFVGSSSVPSEYKLLHNARYPGVVADYRKQFAILASLPCDVFLASHGNFFDLDAKRGKPGAFVDPAAYRAYVAKSKAAFEARLKDEETAEAASHAR